jgi:hypothetical protein
LLTTRGESANAESQGRKHTDVMDLLATTERCAAGQSPTWLSILATHQPGVSVILVTGQASAATVEGVRMLTRRYRTVTVVQVCDPGESVYLPGASVITARSVDGFAPAWKVATLR